MLLTCMTVPHLANIKVGETLVHYFNLILKSQNARPRAIGNIVTSKKVFRVAIKLVMLMHIKKVKKRSNESAVDFFWLHSLVTAVAITGLEIATVL